MVRFLFGSSGSDTNATRRGVPDNLLLLLALLQFVLLFRMLLLLLLIGAAAAWPTARAVSFECIERIEVGSEAEVW